MGPRLPSSGNSLVGLTRGLYNSSSESEAQGNTHTHTHTHTHARTHTASNALTPNPDTNTGWKSSGQGLGEETRELGGQ